MGGLKPQISDQTSNKIASQREIGIRSNTYMTSAKFLFFYPPLCPNFMYMYTVCPQNSIFPLSPLCERRISIAPNHDLRVGSVQFLAQE